MKQLLLRMACTGFLAVTLVLSLNACDTTRDTAIDQASIDDSHGTLWVDLYSTDKGVSVKFFTCDFGCDWKVDDTPIPLNGKNGVITRTIYDSDGNSWLARVVITNLHITSFSVSRCSGGNGQPDCTNGVIDNSP